MNPIAHMRGTFAVIAAVALGAALAAPDRSPSHRTAFAATAPTATPDGILARGKIRTVVLVVMENRTFDNVFGGDTVPGHPTPYPGANAQVRTSIAPLMTTAPFAPDSGEDNWHNEFSCLARGGFSDAQWISAANGNPCGFAMYPPLPSTTQPFKYLDPKYRRIYSAIATSYATSDQFFAVTSTDSYPAHQYIVAGQSADSFGEIVGGQFGGGRGCSDLENNPQVQVIVPALATPGPSVTPSPFTQAVTRSLQGECYNVLTFADQLMRAPVTWGHYVTVDDNGVFNGFMNNQRWWGMQWPLSGDNVLHVAQAGALQNFAWVAPPCVNASDHPNTGNGGPSWVKELVNAIGAGRNRQWEHTAIFVVWDDWGGFYDHATPPPTRAWDQLGPGMRTPFLLISPYVKAGTVVHSTATYGSILRFVEDLYGVPSLNTVDANSPDLTGYFDFTMTPRPFARITAPDETQWRAACAFKTLKPLDRD